MSDTTVLFFHEHPLIRQGMTSLLSSVDGITVHAAGGLRTALSLAETAQPPAVALASVGWPGLEALLARLCRRESGGEGISVALTGPADSALPPTAWPPGVIGYLPEDAAPGMLGYAIRTLSSGGAVFPSSLLSESTGEARQSATTEEETVGGRLSGREGEVLGLLAVGRSNQQIARALGLSEGTVKGYVASIFVKIGAENRIQAALWAHGIRHPPTMNAVASRPMV